MNADWNLKGDWFEDWLDRLGSMEFIDDQRWSETDRLKRGYFTTDTVNGVVVILE